MASRLLRIVLASGLGVIALGVPAAHATTTVVNTADAGAGSLRQAIADAPSGDTIDFAGSVTGTITLTSGELVIDKSLTIAGPGPGILAISANHASRVFHVSGGGLSLSGLTVSDGSATSGGGIFVEPTGGALAVSNCVFTGNVATTLSGGAISTKLSLSVIDSAFENNRASAFGGAIRLIGGSLTNSTFTENAARAGGGVGADPTEFLTVTGCTFTRNTASLDGGGIHSDEFGTLTLSNSTFDGNIAGSAGGGLYRDADFTVSNCTFTGNRSGRKNRTSGGAIFLEDAASGVISNCTITGNSADSSAFGAGIGMEPAIGLVTVQNTIVANNTPMNCAGPLVSGGHNLDSQTSCSFGATGDLTNTQPLLGPLVQNGGPTRTHALLAGSPAIDAGDPAVPGSGGTACEATDQRGVARPGLVACDIGAYESTCGDTVVDLGEQCDDGNLVDGDLCDSNCTFTGCGNGIVTTGEQCDDYNTDDGDCCSSTCQFDSAGTSCPISGSPCTDIDECDGAGLCLRGPQSGCLQSTTGDKASIQFKQDSDPKKSQMKWKWLKGEATALSAFGDPLTTTSYLLCIYDATGLVSNAAAPAGGTCNASNPVPCWKATTPGFKYKDKDLTPDGVSTIGLTSGTSGKAKIGIKAKGTQFDMPLPGTLASPVTVQLRNSPATACWESVFSFPPAKKNSTVQFQDKSDPPH